MTPSSGIPCESLMTPVRPIDHAVQESSPNIHMSAIDDNLLFQMLFVIYSTYIFMSQCHSTSVITKGDMYVVMTLIYAYRRPLNGDLVLLYDKIYCVRSSVVNGLYGHVYGHARCIGRGSNGRMI